MSVLRVFRCAERARGCSRCARSLSSRAELSRSARAEGSRLRYSSTDVQVQRERETREGEKGVQQESTRERSQGRRDEGTWGKGAARALYKLTSSRSTQTCTKLPSMLCSPATPAPTPPPSGPKSSRLDSLCASSSPPALLDARVLAACDGACACAWCGCPAPTWLGAGASLFAGRSDGGTLGSGGRALAAAAAPAPAAAAAAAEPEPEPVRAPPPRRLRSASARWTCAR